MKASSNAPGKASSKRERVEFLLDHWQDFFDTSGGGPVTGSGGDPPAISSMSRHPSVLELGRCLEVLSLRVPRHYEHLAGFYRAEWRTTTEDRKQRTRSGKLTVVAVPVRARVLPRWVQPRLVSNAVDMVVGLFNGPAEAPLALVQKLRPLADSDGWTEAA